MKPAKLISKLDRTSLQPGMLSSNVMRVCIDGKEGRKLVSFLDSAVRLHKSKRAKDLSAKLEMVRDHGFGGSLECLFGRKQKSIWIGVGKCAGGYCLRLLVCMPVGFVYGSFRVDSLSMLADLSEARMPTAIKIGMMYRLDWSPEIFGFHKADQSVNVVLDWEHQRLSFDYEHLSTGHVSSRSVNRLSYSTFMVPSVFDGREEDVRSLDWVMESLFSGATIAEIDFKELVRLKALKSAANDDYRARFVFEIEGERYLGLVSAGGAFVSKTKANKFFATATALEWLSKFRSKSVGVCQGYELKVESEEYSGVRIEEDGMLFAFMEKKVSEASVQGWLERVGESISLAFGGCESKSISEEVLLEMRSMLRMGYYEMYVSLEDGKWCLHGCHSKTHYYGQDEYDWREGGDGTYPREMFRVKLNLKRLRFLLAFKTLEMVGIRGNEGIMNKMLALRSGDELLIAAPIYQS